MAVAAGSIASCQGIRLNHWSKDRSLLLVKRNPAPGCDNATVWAHGLCLCLFCSLCGTNIGGFIPLHIMKARRVISCIQADIMPNAVLDARHAPARHRYCASALACSYQVLDALLTHQLSVMRNE
eukprot:scaffold615964_cov37-Prasinocladus_malaysianus.AAC.1